MALMSTGHEDVPVVAIATPENPKPATGGNPATGGKPGYTGPPPIPLSDDERAPTTERGYRITLDRLAGDPMRLGGPPPAALLARLLSRVARGLGDAGRPAVEAIARGVEDAEAGKPPAW